MEAKDFKLKWKKGKPYFPSGYYLVTWPLVETTTQTLTHIYSRKGKCYYNFVHSNQANKGRKGVVTEAANKPLLFETITKITKAQYNMLLTLWRKS